VLIRSSRYANYNINFLALQMATQPEREELPASFRRGEKKRREQVLVYVRRKSKRTFGQTDGGYLAMPGTLLEEDQASQAWRSALRYGLPSSGKR
jgi:hypothetical protein